jgi:WD40 repeat protein
MKNSFNWLGEIESVSGLAAHQRSLCIERPGHKDARRTEFLVLAVTAPNCIRLKMVDIVDNHMSKSLLSQFYITSGRITGFDIHPSKDYLLVTSNRGTVYVFRLDTGELRGTITVPLHAQGCCIDPSGLYVLIQVPPFSA